MVSAHGGVDPGSETADYGTVLAQGITNSPLSGGEGTQFVCMAAAVEATRSPRSTRLT